MKIHLCIYAASLLIALSACVSNTKKKIKEAMYAPKLQLVWQTDSLLTTCESALYHKPTGIIYVSNVNQSPWELDGNGFISTIDTLGNILEEKWIEGLSGPKGMGIVNNSLFVTDINQVVEIDIASQSIINTFPVEGKTDLNDITVSPDGIVFVSGSASGTIYTIKDGQMDTLVSKNFDRLNGLYYSKDGLYYATSGGHEFGFYNKGDSTTMVLTSEIGHGDGIVQLSNKDFIVSSWSGEIFYISAKDWSKIQLLDTREKKINAADIDYIPELNLLLVPSFFNNRIMAYRISSINQ